MARKQHNKLLGFHHEFVKYEDDRTIGEMLRSGRIVRVEGERNTYKLLDLTAGPSGSHESPATISPRESVINALACAGIIRSRTARLSERRKMERLAEHKPAEDFIEQAQIKVRLWPKIGDTKAVRVGPAISLA